MNARASTYKINKLSNIGSTRAPLFNQQFINTPQDETYLTIIQYINTSDMYRFRLFFSTSIAHPQCMP